MSASDAAQQPPPKLAWLVAVVLACILLELFGLFLVYFTEHALSIFAFVNLSGVGLFSLGKLFLLVPFFILLLYPRTRRAWPEIGCAALLLLPFILSTAVALTPPLATMPSSRSTANSSPGAVFNLPAAKVQSDLTGLKPNDSIVLILVADHQQHRYEATLIDVQGVGSEALTPPYKNKDAVTIHTSISLDTNDTTATEFANQLAGASAIFLLPSASVPSLIKASATFDLPTAKVQSDLSFIQVGSDVALLLLANQQVYHYRARVQRVNGYGNTPVSAPYGNEKVTSIGISLTDASDDIIIAFVGQLSEATAIYLLPLQKINMYTI